MKKLAKDIVSKILGWQVRCLLKKNNIKIIVVVGSIGKTSTKFAIAQVLEKQFSVRWQKGNYNHIVSVPLIFFGESLPSLFNPLSWLKVFISNQRQIKNYKYEVVVVELGTDGPGQIAQFKSYINADIAVITAIAPEHMEFFNSLDAVAAEEFAISEYSKKLIINTDLVADKYLKLVDNQVITYGENTVQYTFNLNDDFVINKDSEKWLTPSRVNSKVEAYSSVAAAIVGTELEMSESNITKGLDTLLPVAGRMQSLKGIKNSIVIDDTYNASPDAVIAALDELYQQNAPQKIAMLGNMNELGEFSQKEHERVGAYCDPKRLDLVITVGPDANNYLAKAAEQRGCKVESFKTPYQAGVYVANNLKSKAVILAKGSQNNVYMEEALKSLLDNKSDASKLVRQSKQWLVKKDKNFAANYH